MYIFPSISTECFSLLDRYGPDRCSSRFITLPKGYYHCDRLSHSCHRLSNLLDKRHRTQAWHRFGRGIGLVPVVVKQETNTNKHLCNTPNHETEKPWDEHQKKSRKYEIPPSATRLTRRRRHAPRTESHTHKRKFSDEI